MEDELSTVVLPANIFTDQIEDEFCPITRPQVGTSLSGSTMSSTVREEHVTEIQMLRENCTRPTKD